MSTLKDLHPHSFMLFSELGIKKVTRHQLGLLESNLTLIRNNALCETPEQWKQVIQHFAWPEENQMPPVFLVPFRRLQGYNVVMQIVDDLYTAS